MAKKSAAKKALGLDPFAAPKSGVRLLSIESSPSPVSRSRKGSAHSRSDSAFDRPTGADEQVSEEPRKPAARAKAATSQTASRKAATAPKPAPVKAPKTRPTKTRVEETSAKETLEGSTAHAQQAPARAPGFDRMAGELAQRLQTNRPKELSAEQMRRIDDLLAQLDRADLPQLERSLAARLEKAWQYFRMYGRSTSVDDFGLDPKFEELVDPLFDFMYSKWWRVETSGIENVPADGRALLVSNHSGMLPWDGGMIKYAIRKEHPAHRDVRPLVEDFVYHQPFLGALMARIGGVRASQENAQRLLQKDEAVVVFPEGVKGIAKLYRYRYQLQRFGRGGFVKLCLRTGAPIIPVSVVGAEEIHPIVARADFLARPLKIPVFPLTPTFPLLGPLGLIPFPTKWFIQFGRPIDLRQYGKAALDDELLINRITHEVRQQIQEQIYEQLKKRRSVFFG